MSEKCCPGTRGGTGETPMDIGNWLRSLGLEEYEPVFRANAIDAAVLPHLTAEDLKELGVVLVGPRPRLPHAIAAIGTELSMAAAATTPSKPQAENAERRQLTVMF